MNMKAALYATLALLVSAFSFCILMLLPPAVVAAVFAVAMAVVLWSLAYEWFKS